MDKIKQLLLVLLLVSFTSISLFAQNFNEKLLVKYDAESLTQMQQNNSGEFELVNYFVDKGCYFVDMPDKPIEYYELEKIDPVTGESDFSFDFNEFDFDNFNPLEYNCVFDQSRSNYYKVGNTGKLLIVLSRSDMENKIENEKRVLQNK